MLKLTPPLFLLEAPCHCWRCSAEASAIALAVQTLAERESENEPFEDVSDPSEPAILSYILTLPDDLLAEMRKVLPSFSLQKSHTTGDSYFANSCPACSALLGDHFMHSEPGGAFFPEDEAAAKRIKIHRLPIARKIEIDASPHYGLGGFIFKFGQKL